MLPDFRLRRKGSKYWPRGRGLYLKKKVDFWNFGAAAAKTYQDIFQKRDGEGLSREQYVFSHYWNTDGLLPWLSLKVEVFTAAGVRQKILS